MEKENLAAKINDFFKSADARLREEKLGKLRRRYLCFVLLHSILKGCQEILVLPL